MFEHEQLLVQHKEACVMGLKEEEWQPDSTESRRGERAEETDFCSWPGPAPGPGPDVLRGRER